ncbi:MAG: hypothetical protein L0H53_02955 [Candidatus Nitrosocosmicus sp.]|nr:hypothetical protein [Candidatus Nitrosocosmicus sp.]MDN5866391.1 hypothetical protein [Candidatus Nitrosocosmicus sp.]
MIQAQILLKTVRRQIIVILQISQQSLTIMKILQYGITINYITANKIHIKRREGSVA